MTRQDWSNFWDDLGIRWGAFRCRLLRSHVFPPQHFLASQRRMFGSTQVFCFRCFVVLIPGEPVGDGLFAEYVRTRSDKGS